MARPSPAPFAVGGASPGVVGAPSPIAQPAWAAGRRDSGAMVDTGVGTEHRPAEMCPRCNMPVSHTPFCTATGIPHTGCKKCSLDIKTYKYCMVTGKLHYQSDLKHLPAAPRTAHKAAALPLATQSERNDARSQVLLFRTAELIVAKQVKAAFVKTVRNLSQVDVSAMPYPKPWLKASKVPKMRRC